MFKRVLIMVAAMLFVSTIALAARIEEPLQIAVNELQPGETIQALVYLSEQADIPALNLELKKEHATLGDRNRRVISALQEIATQSQPDMASFLETLKAQGSVTSYKMFWIANMFSVEATREGIESIAARSDIEGLYFNYPIENIEPVQRKEDQDLIAGHEIGLTRINAPAVWAQGWTGAGRVVMNIDTGVEGTHPALSARFRGDVDGDGDVSESWFDPYDTHYPTPTDDGGHGTHTMGTICGRTVSGDTIGVAINARWIAAGAIDRGGGIPRTVADAILSFQWAVDPDGNPNTQDNPDAIGNSWGVTTSHGYPPCDQTFWAVIDNCEAAGSAVIFSAGNEGPSANTLRRPADRGTTPYNCFSVGAVDGSDPNLPIASFSSRGPSNCGPGGQSVIKPEVVAPGVNVRSSYPGGGYTTLSGTSMASPHITGSVAILRQVNPNLDVDAIKEILMQTATDLGPGGEDNTYGHGVINLQAAVQMAMTGFGFVDGYVRDASNNNPLPATVSVVGSPNSVNANSSGYYFMALPADTTYTLRASYFGYIPLDHTVAVFANDTTSQNFLLSPAPSAILQGHVLSTAGDSIANAVLTILGTPIAPDTTDSHGFYRFPAVPTGSVYRVQAQANNYSFGLDSILIQSGTNILDFQLYPAESFENNDGQYNGSGVWQWGTPTAGPPGAHSGTKLWGTVLGGQYPNNVNDPLYSRDYNIVQPGARLEFYHWYSMESTYDGGNLSISTDGGGSWALLTPDGGYPDPDVQGLGNEPGYSAASDWTLARFDISGYIGQTVRFRWRFGSDGSVVDYGWYIDDVSVVGSGTPLPPNITYDPSSFVVAAAPGQVETRFLHINNTGTGYLNFTLSPEIFTGLNIRGNSPIPITLSSNLSTPIGYTPADADKPGSIAEPIYPPIIQSQGGPDTYGHRWIDSDEPGGPSVAWVDISGPGTPVTLTDDSNVGPINIGFSFPFFENTYNQLYICSNGMVTFGTGSNIYSNTGIPNSAAPNNFIPIWWDDLNPGVGGTVRYYYDSANSRFIVSYDGVPNYSTGGNLNFQAVLYITGKIELNYASMNPGTDDLVSSTIGIENSVGNDGLQIVYNAAYMHSNLSIRISKGWLFVSPGNGNVAPGGSASATITFDATNLNAGTYTGRLNLDSNDPDSPNIDIPVTFDVGSGGTPDIVQTPSNINDTLAANNSAIHVLKVNNTGTATLMVTFSDSATWITVTPGPYNIPPGDSLMQDITLNSTGLAPGTYNSRVVTASNDPDTPNIILPVTLLVTPAGIPDINIAPLAFVDTVQEGNTRTRNLFIDNMGSAQLIYGLHDNRAWITVTPDTGLADPGLRDTVQVVFSAVSLTPGTYTGQININSNDPDESLLTLPVTLVVQGGGGSGCQYVVGDVNNNGSFNGIDVTFGVSYFKGGSVPPYSCECTPGNTWFVAGDVNGSCVFNGIDITYMVSYFKGGSAPVPCADCPPALLPAIEKPVPTFKPVSEADQDN